MVDCKMLEANTNNDFRSLLKLVVENPIAHVNRSEYLAKVFKVTESDIINGHLDISLKERKKVAQKQMALWAMSLFYLTNLLHLNCKSVIIEYVRNV